jgi:very-short-patch-repair endonuclease
MLAAMSIGAMSIGARPFRGSVAVASGVLTADQLRGHAYRRLFQDVYVAARVRMTQRLLIQAAALRLPADGVITGRSAAYLWGAELGSVGDAVEVLSRRRLGPARGIVSRCGGVRGDELRWRYRVRVPTPLHTAWELARTLPPVEAVQWIDALARACRLDTAALIAHAREHTGEHRSVQAMKVLPLCDRRAESPPESLVRVSLVLAGLPTPTPQYQVVVSGRFIARVDLAWEAIKLALEYDGQWHADRDQLTRDRVRIRNLNAAGWYVYPVTRDDLRDLERLVATIRGLIYRRSRLL